MFYYFAYGSVLSLDHAREWCVSHALDSATFLGGKPAKLPGWKLVFDVPSRFWQGLVANLDEDAQSSVEGVVFEVDDVDRIAVLRKEGVATGLYRELKLPVLVGDEEVVASVFVAEQQRRATPGPASSRYVDALVAGARERGLSPAWQQFVASLERDEARPPPPGISLGIKRG